jgi:osmoprotectant transport system ATP-binding protein
MDGAAASGVHGAAAPDANRRRRPLFALEEVSKHYGTVPALNRVNLVFAAGSVTALIGGSGSGKSSLLRMLIGLERPDRGRVLIEGQPLLPEGRMALRRRVGYVTQDGSLFPHLSARDNLALLPRCLGWTGARIDARARELAAQMQIEPELLRRFPAELSGGQRQRVSIMRALMPDPAALLLDEPLGALDPLVRYDLQEQLRTLFAAAQRTVVVVTHDLAEAVFLAPRLVLIRDGCVVQDGTPQDLVGRPADEQVRRFVGARRGLPGLPA